LHGITDGMTDERHQTGGDGSKQGAEKGAQAVGSLKAGFGDGGRDFDKHEQKGEECRAETGSDNGAGGDFKDSFHVLLHRIV